MGSACSSNESKGVALDSSNAEHINSENTRTVKFVNFDTKDQKEAGAESKEILKAKEDTETSTMSRKASNKHELKKRTYSVFKMQKHDLLEAQHPEMKEVLENFKMAAEKIPSMHDQIYYDDMIALLQDKFIAPFESYSEPDQRELMGDHLAKIKFVTVILEYYESLLKEMGLESVTMEDITVEEGEEEDSDEDEYDDKRLVRHIRLILWNFSDNSPRLGEEIAHSKMFYFLIKDLQRMSVDISKIKSDDFAYLSAVNIIGNCGRSPAPLSCYTVDMGNDVKTEIVKCLLPFLEKSSIEFVRIQILLVLSHIVNENQFHYLTTDENLLIFLINMIDSALKKSDRRHYGFSVQELLSGLSGMARNDDIITKIMELERPFPLIKEVILNNLVAEQTEACSILHKSAFKPKYKEKIMNDKGLWKKLNELQDSDTEVLSEAAKSACFIINSFKKDREEPGFGSAISPEKKEKHIMISYCQTNTKMVMEIYNKLVGSNFKVWMDIYDLGGESLLDAMSRAVEDAAIVLVCYSEDYYFSKNCRTEAEYAYDQGKEKMFVRLEYKYKPKGWLGAIRGAMKYYDFSGQYDLIDKYNEFLRDVRAKLIQVQAVDAIVPAKLRKWRDSTKSEKSEEKSEEKSNVILHKWTQKDMDDWFKKNNLQMFAGLKKLTGPQLTFLYKVFRRAPEFFYRCLEEKLGLKSLEDLMRFSDAVENLRKEFTDIDDILL